MRRHPGLLLILCSGAGCVSDSFQVELDSVRFAKLCRESGLLGGKLTTTAVDLSFTKVKSKVGSSGLGSSLEAWLKVTCG